MWSVQWDERALKELAKLPRTVQERVYSYIDERILKASHPTDIGKPLAANKKGLWRYRIGDYRLLCKLNESTIGILIVAVGHRKDIYE